MMPLLAISSIQSVRGAAPRSPRIRRECRRHCLGRENLERLAMTLDEALAILQFFNPSNGGPPIPDEKKPAYRYAQQLVAETAVAAARAYVGLTN